MMVEAVGLMCSLAGLLKIHLFDSWSEEFSIRHHAFNTTTALLK